MKQRIVLVLTLVVGLVSFALGQVYPKPNSPSLDYITNNLDNGNVTIYWTPPAHEPQIADPLGYIIYIPRDPDNPSGDGWEPIDTVDQNTFSYTHVGANANGKRALYRVASLGANEPSQQTPYHSLVWITSNYDSCNAKIDLSWELYEGWPLDADAPYKNVRYQLFMGNELNWSNYQKIGDFDGYTTKYSIRNVLENTDYFFYIKATRIDKGYESYSNLYLIHTKMAIRPTYAFIDSVVATNNGNKIYYTIDPNTGITNFKLWRWEQPDTSQSIFSAIVVEQFADPTKTMSIDTNNTWAARTRKFYYKIDAYNGCDQAVMVSNLCNSIIPRLSPKGKNVEIQWTDMFKDTERKPDRLNNSIVYSIFRRSFTVNDDITGVGNLERIADGIANTEFTDDLSGFEGQDPIYRIVFNYYIEGIELTPSGDTVTLSRSRELSTEILPGVTMPTALSPSDVRSNYGHQRNLFKPIITFDANFTLTIYDRWGGVVYHGNEGWDGRNSKGEFVKEGTYVYRLVISTSNAGEIIKNGSVSVVYTNR
jgi:hypothetical protein